jgi:ubiquinone/menaquinone biosynthesis C-methylase UbiE
MKAVMTEPRPVPTTSYEPFSEEPEYVHANDEFVASLPLRGRARVLDLACGAGILSEMMFRLDADLRIAQLDLSRESLQLTADRLAAGALVPRSLGLIQASADVLPIAPASLDGVVMGNAIHILPDPDVLLAEIRRVIRKDGLFAFNTSFYAGTYPPGTEKLYHHWLIEALKFASARAQANPSDARLRRVRGAGRGRSSPWPTKKEWVTRLERHGFKLHSIYERTVIMTPRSLEAVGAYAGLASVLLSGYPVDLACEALMAAAAPAFAAAGVKSVPRLWLEIAAIKGGTADADR